MKRYISGIINSRHFQHSFFLIKFRYFTRFKTKYRLYKYRFLGMKVGYQTMLPSFYITWPHQVEIGSYCRLEQNIFFKYDGAWSKGPSIKISDNVFIGSSCEFNITHGIEIGENSLIASGCKFIDHNHGIYLSQIIRNQKSTFGRINIGSDVWLGFNVIVLKGVTIGNGAIVGAGSVVTKSISKNEIWAGIPARKIGERKIR